MTLSDNGTTSHRHSQPFSEQQPLSEQEVEQLQQWGNPYVFHFLFAIVFLPLDLLVLIRVDLDLFTLIGTGSIGLFGIGVSYLFFKARVKVRLDLSGGQKMILQAGLESKREDSSGYSSSYYCTLSGQEFKVGFEQWEKATVGQLMQLHFAPHSRYVFELLAAEYTDETIR